MGAGSLPARGRERERSVLLLRGGRARAAARVGRERGQERAAHARHRHDAQAGARTAARRQARQSGGHPPRGGTLPRALLPLPRRRRSGSGAGARGGGRGRDRTGPARLAQDQPARPAGGALTILAASLLGGALALDATALGQFMLSRPMAAGLLAGWLAGDPATGFLVGVVLEIYLLVAFPVGGASFPEGATGTVVAAVTAASHPG